MESYPYFLAAVPILGVAAQWLAWRYRLPSILLLLAFGVALGSILQQSYPSSELVPEELLFPIVSLS
ncbi:MAG: hypothetical protein QF805_19560, partial [Pirellulaceae bacterium]|nr:hypothetical protein [Pirellulaceae bacterium]